jgi:hypothetical protein
MRGLPAGEGGVDAVDGRDPPPEVVDEPVDSLANVADQRTDPQVGAVRHPQVRDGFAQRRPLTPLAGRAGERVTVVGAGHHVEHERGVLDGPVDRAEDGERVGVDERIGAVVAVGTRPKSGMSPKTPQAAGTRTEPAASEPWTSGTIPAATVGCGI